jgi:sarcosine oxidase subunit beta
MTRPVQIVIIGAGVIGASVAAHLAKRGERPLVLERDHICAGTTGQSGGVIRQHYSNPSTAAMARDALERFRHWSDYYEGSAGFIPTGVMLTAGAATEAGVRANVSRHLALGIETSLLTVEEALAIEPRLRLEDCTLACFEPTSGQADTLDTTWSFAQTARSLGVEIREGVAVDEIVVRGGRVTGVRTSDGDIAAEVVINAAGVWGVALQAGIGPALPITFSRHPMAYIKRAPDDRQRHPIVLDVHADSYFIPRDEFTLVGKLGTMPEDLDVSPDDYARGVSNDEIERFLESSRNRLPSLCSGTVLGGWAGIYDDSLDAHPIIDEVPGAEGLFCALGMSGNCFKLSPILGDLIARRVIDGPDAAPDLAMFRIDRFADGMQHDRAFGAISVLA